jgi:hypothetical protein
MPEPLPQAAMSAAAIDLLQREIANPETQWSLGTFGAIAEFSQMKSLGHASAALTAWLASYDSASSEEIDDEAAPHQNG